MYYYTTFFGRFVLLLWTNINILVIEEPCVVLTYTKHMKGMSNIPMPMSVVPL